MQKRTLIGLCAALVAAPATSFASAVTVQDYTIIVTGDRDDTLNLSNTELGAISDPAGNNFATGNYRSGRQLPSPPQGNPARPNGTRGVIRGVLQNDGDVAVTDNIGPRDERGTITLSNSDIHAAGSTTKGARGIDCAFNDCSDGGSQLTSNNRYNTDSPTPSYSNLSVNNGVYEGVDLDAIITELGNFETTVLGLSSTATITLSDGKIDGLNRFVNLVSGLNVIDIDTNDNDFLVNNANLIVNGDAGSKVIFRINSGAKMIASNAEFLLAGDIGLNSVLFWADGPQGADSFDFSNVEFYGYSFFDIVNPADVDDFENSASFDNVRGCGQVVTDSVDYNDVSQTNCAFA
ncbi:MAG: hypothetical protein AAF607_11910, partial [Pseudomonadota bacterium]